jgi:hypothetical protein
MRAISAGLISGAAGAAGDAVLVGAIFLLQAQKTILHKAITQNFFMLSNLGFAKNNGFAFYKVPK